MSIEQICLLILLFVVLMATGLLMMIACTNGDLIKKPRKFRMVRKFPF